MRTNLKHMLVVPRKARQMFGLMLDCKRSLAYHQRQKRTLYVESIATGRGRNTSFGTQKSSEKKVVNKTIYNVPAPGIEFAFSFFARCACPLRQGMKCWQLLLATFGHLLHVSALLLVTRVGDINLGKAASAKHQVAHGIDIGEIGPDGTGCCHRFHFFWDMTLHKQDPNWSS